MYIIPFCGACAGVGERASVRSEQHVLCGIEDVIERFINQSVHKNLPHWEIAITVAISDAFFARFKQSRSAAVPHSRATIARTSQHIVLLIPRNLRCDIGRALTAIYDYCRPKQRCFLIAFHGLCLRHHVYIVDNSLHFVKNFSRFVLKGLATHVYNSLNNGCQLPQQHIWHFHHTLAWLQIVSESMPAEAFHS